MSAEQFKSLIDDLCTKFHVTYSNVQTKNVYDFNVNGTIFTLQHGGESDPDNLLIFCEFGELPEKHMEAALERLMEANVFFFRRKGPRFSVNPDSAQVMLCDHAPLSQVSADLAIAILGKLSIYAGLWRRYFLLDDEERNGAAMSALPHQSNLKPDIGKADSAPVLVERFPDIAVRFLDVNEAVMDSAAFAELADTDGALELPFEMLNAFAEMEKEGLLQRETANGSK